MLPHNRRSIKLLNQVRKPQLAAESEELGRYRKAELVRIRHINFIRKVYGYGVLMALFAIFQGILISLSMKVVLWIKIHNYISIIMMWPNFFLLLFYLKVYEDLQKRRIITAVFVFITLELATFNFLTPASYSHTLNLVYAAIITVVTLAGSLYMTFSVQADVTSLDIKFLFIWTMRSYIGSTSLICLASSTHSHNVEIILAVVLIIFQFLIGLAYGRAIGVKQFFIDNKHYVPMLVILCFYNLLNLFSVVLMLIEAAYGLMTSD